MTTRQIAEKIPAEYRREILQTNMINQAIANNADAGMHYLGTIWKNYIAPGEDLNCGMCLIRILENYRGLQADLITLEKESTLLSGV